MYDFESFLSSGSPCGEVSADQLRSYAQRAASAFVNSQEPMSATIAGFAKEASLNAEQTKRVVEEANNAAFKALFKQGHAKNIEFPVADFDTVMSSMGVEKTASVAMPVLATNSRRYIPGAEGLTDAGIFGLNERPLADRFIKEAAKAAPPKMENLIHQHAQQKSDLQSGLFSFTEGMNRLVGMAKQAAADGYAPATVGAAIEAVSTNPGLLNVIGEELGDLAVFDHFEKIAQAGMEVSPQSPFTGLVQDLESMSQKLVMSQQAVNQTQASMDGLLQVLRGPVTGMAADPMFQPQAPDMQQPAPPPEVAPPGAPAQAPPPAAPPGAVNA